MHDAVNSLWQLVGAFNYENHSSYMQQQQQPALWRHWYIYTYTRILTPSHVHTFLMSPSTTSFDYTRSSCDWQSLFHCNFRSITCIHTNWCKCGSKSDDTIHSSNRSIHSSLPFFYILLVFISFSPSFPKNNNNSYVFVKRHKGQEAITSFVNTRQ